MITKESWRRDIARVSVWFLFRWFIVYFPCDSKEFSLFRFLGRLHYSLSRGIRGILRENLNRGLEGQKNDISFDKETKGYLENSYVSNMLILMVPKFRRGAMDRYHRFEHFDRIEHATRAKKGCILIHPHFGAVQLPFFHLGFKCHNILQIGELIEPSDLSIIGKKVFRIRKKYEDSLPVTILSPRAFLRPVFEHLKNNGLIMIPGDGTGGGRFIGKFITVDFLGQKMKFPVGAVSLALKTGAPIVPIFTVPDGNGYYKTIVENPLTLIHHSEKLTQIQINVQQFANLFEQYVIRYPSMWLLWDEFRPGMLLEKSD